MSIKKFETMDILYRSFGKEISGKSFLSPSQTSKSLNNLDFLQKLSGIRVSDESYLPETFFPFNFQRSLTPLHKSVSDKFLVFNKSNKCSENFFCHISLTNLVKNELIEKESNHASGKEKIEKEFKKSRPEPEPKQQQECSETTVQFTSGHEDETDSQEGTDFESEDSECDDADDDEHVIWDDWDEDDDDGYIALSDCVDIPFSSKSFPQQSFTVVSSQTSPSLNSFISNVKENSFSPSLCNSFQGLNDFNTELEEEFKNALYTSPTFHLDDLIIVMQQDEEEADSKGKIIKANSQWREHYPSPASDEKPTKVCGIVSENGCFILKCVQPILNLTESFFQFEETRIFV